VLRSNIVNVDEIAGLADVFDICGGGGGGGGGPTCAKLATVAAHIIAAAIATRRITPLVRQDRNRARAIATPDAASINTVKAPSHPQRPDTGAGQLPIHDHKARSRILTLFQSDFQVDAASRFAEHLLHSTQLC
jgi:hypothetical protein